MGLKTSAPDTNCMGWIQAEPLGYCQGFGCPSDKVALVWKGSQQKLKETDLLRAFFSYISTKEGSETDQFCPKET